MKKRCCSPTSSGYARYGGRGIKYCVRWEYFDNFLADMGEREVGQCIHRIDNDGDYEPGNCVWMGAAEHNSHHHTRRG